MLQRLHIQNYALFKHVSVEFGPGLNILTGETGAGKSMFIGALGLITGHRAAATAIFDETKKCVIEAEFGHLSQNRIVQLAIYEEFDLPTDSLAIRREIQPSGKSRAFINDTPVSLKVLNEVSSILLDMHGQHENQSLLAPESQLDLIDEYAGTRGLAAEFGGKLRAAQRILDEIKRLQDNERAARQQMEFYRFQAHELGQAHLRPGEEEELEQELNRLQNSTDLREALGFACATLYEAEDSLHGRLGEVVARLRKLAAFDAEILDKSTQLGTLQEQLREASGDLLRILEQVDMDPERLDFLEKRLALYHSLKQKYSLRTGEELIALYESVQAKLADVEAVDEKVEALRQDHARAAADLAELGGTLERLRMAARTELEREVNALLTEVGFKQAEIQVNLERVAAAEGSPYQLEGQPVQATPRGFNRVQLLIRTNPGLPAGPLAGIASGGEISRVMLAIKAAMAHKSDFAVLVFDEIDTGISGEIAQKVGHVMRRLGERFQILCITHLPQMAAKGNQHYEIVKDSEGGSTQSDIRPLAEYARIKAIAKMLSGDNPTDFAIRNAMELIGGGPLPLVP